MQLSGPVPKPPSYTAPKSGILVYLPNSCVPYAELMRIHKPVGIMNIFFPYLYGSLFAACVRSHSVPPASVISTGLKLFPLALLLRSAGCTWNDIIDRDVDRKVARCRLRPVARGAVSPRQGYLFFTAQIILWFILVAQAELEAMSYAVVALFLAQIYPFAKRFTDYAQVVLGVALSWGTLVGCKVGMTEPMTLLSDQPLLATALVCLCLSYALWTVIHDTIYGFQDVEDDAKAGVKSLCVRYRHCPTILLSTLAAAQIVCHLAIGVAMGANMLYYFGSCIIASFLLGAMVWSIDVGKPEECWWWFQWGSLAMGSTMTLSLVGQYSTSF